MKEEKRSSLWAWVVVAIVSAVGLWFFTLGGWQCRVNSECVKVFKTKPHYKAWTMSYSNGLEARPDGTWKNHWRMPQFHWLDMEAVMEKRAKEAEGLK